MSGQRQERHQRNPRDNRAGGGYRGGDRGGNRGGPQGLPQELKLDHFYTESGSLCPDVYLETAEKIAQIFVREGLKVSSIRRFFEAVRAAHEQYTQDPDPDQKFDRAMVSVYRLRPLARYSEERDVTKRCFTDFMEHYIQLTAKDGRNLKGFKELFMSVVGYLKK